MDKSSDKNGSSDEKFGRRAALSDNQKDEIRRKLAAGATARGLAKDYGVSHPTILKVVE